MSEFPKWLLALAGISLLPLLACPLFLFGGQPFGTSSHSFVRFLLYIATQLLWLLPIAGFFLSLDSWRRGFYKRSVIISLASAALSILSFVLVLS